MSVSGPTLVTPGRQTHVRFDYQEVVQAELPFGIQRAGNQIARDRTQSNGVELLGSGAWALQPQQRTLAVLRETTTGQSAILPAAAWQLASGVSQINRWRSPADLLGATINAGVAATGDAFLQKRVAAGGSWASNLAADEAAFPSPTNLLPSQNVKMDRVAVSNLAYRADQPFLVRWETMGARVEHPDSDLMKQFGGPASPDGSGWYALIIGGSGVVILAERINGTWVERDNWRYGTLHGRAIGMHSMRVWPHYDTRGGGYIEFEHDLTEGKVWTVAGSSNALTSGYYAPPHLNDRHVYTIPGRITQYRPNVTGPGQFRVDVRQDQRTLWQTSLVSWPAAATGLLVDQAFALPRNSGVLNPLKLYWSAIVPDGCALTGALYDADTSSELAVVASGPNYRYYTPNAGQNRYYAAFSFASDPAGSLTPYLWSYSVARDATGIAPIGLTEFEPDLVRSVSITGPEADPSHETADLLIEDLTNSLTTLRTRANIRTRIETEYDPLDSTKRSVLFDGFAGRNPALKRGYNGGQLYPSPEWRQFQATFTGMWTRLHQQFALQRFSLAEDPSAEPDANGIRPPYKVTDACRMLISAAGFDSTQIDIPDNAIRFYPCPGGDEALIVTPLTNPAEFVTRALRDYLGWYLIWDGNAGIGMWRARAAATSPYRNLVNFVTTGPDVAGRLPHRPESYTNASSAHGAWISTDAAVADVPILRRDGKPSFRTWVKAPEANAVLVTGVGQITPDRNGQYRLSQWAMNLASADMLVDAHGAVTHTADPTNPDYLGYIVPLVVIDPTLGTTDAVNWVCRRYYDVTCHAIKMATFDGPLVLITDLQDAQQTELRKLQYYDPVTVDGTQWLVRNCNPTYVKDGYQYAYYELEAPRF